VEAAAVIAKLAGIVDHVGADMAVIDVHGVGYLVFCSARTVGRLPSAGSAARLLIETHVRDDHIHLYGFIDAAERDWFRRLTTVQGVGPRLAIALLSIAEPDQLALAIIAQDKATLARAEGVGARLAARIVNELRDKINGLPSTAAGASAAPPSPLGLEGSIADAASALVNLGYRASEAYAAVAAAAQRVGDVAEVGTLIKAALQELAQSHNARAPQETVGDR
jgi:holliday junction DNA helicase RuvA